MTIQERNSISVTQIKSRNPIPVQNLRFPAPPQVYVEILEEMIQPLINHRGPEFVAILKHVTSRLQHFFQMS